MRELCKYHFTEEGSNDVLKVVESQTELEGIKIDKTIEELEDMYGCMVLWEKVD